MLCLSVHEQTATHITSYEPLYIPGLLQTEGYARAVFQLAGHSEEQANAAVHVRLNRQQDLCTSPGGMPQCIYFIAEQALRKPAGGRDVMYEQMVSLLMAIGTDEITVRVVPSTTQLYIPGAFRMMTFTRFGPAGYTEGVGVSTYLERDVDIARYRSLIELLDEASLNVADSSELLQDLGKGIRAALGEGSHDWLAQEQLQQR